MSELEPNLQGLVMGLEEFAGARFSRDDRFSPLTHAAIRGFRKKFRMTGLVLRTPLQGTIDDLIKTGVEDHVRDHLFDAVLTADQYRNGGTNPERFLTIAQMLYLRPPEIVAVMSDLQSVESAKRAGCYVVGLTFEYNHQQLYDAGADTSARTYLSAYYLLDQPLKK